MTRIAYITADQAKELNGMQWQPDSYFAPFEIEKGTWAISEQEVNGCVTKGLEWVGKLELIEHDRNSTNDTP